MKKNQSLCKWLHKGHRQRKVCHSKAPEADGIMIARAAAERPWIFAQIKNGLEDSAEKITVDRMQTALNFIDNVEKFQPKEFHKTRIQRFFRTTARSSNSDIISRQKCLITSQMKKAAKKFVIIFKNSLMNASFKCEFSVLRSFLQNKRYSCIFIHILEDFCIFLSSLYKYSRI